MAGMAHNLNEMGMVLSAQHDEAQARKLLAEAFAIYGQESMAGEVSRTLNSMATSYVRKEN
jgi:hypothetical protein